MSLNQDELFAALDSSDEPIIESYREHQARKRGLPIDGPLKDLARTYLEDKHRLWPQLVDSGILPPINEPTLDRMVDEFKRAFLTGSISAAEAHAENKGIATIGARYSRYSDDNSNARSLNQQLHNELERAAKDDVFIPTTLPPLVAQVSASAASKIVCFRSR